MTNSTKPNKLETMINDFEKLKKGTLIELELDTLSGPSEISTGYFYGFFADKHSNLNGSQISYSAEKYSRHTGRTAHLAYSTLGMIRKYRIHKSLSNSTQLK